MKILITGSRGQLGTELQKCLAERRSELGPIPESYRGAEVVAVDIDILDIADERAVSALVAEVSPDLIINCSANTDVDGCEADEAGAFRVNADGPRHLARAAKRCGAAMVHLSTDYVFSGDDGKIYREDDAPGPQTAYGRSKLAGEIAVREETERHYIVRTAWLYAVTGRNFVRTIAALAAERPSISVVDDQRGCPTSAGDLAHFLLALAATGRFGTYHCVNRGVASWYAFAKAIVAHAGAACAVSPCTTAEFPRPARRPVYSPLCCDKIEGAVGRQLRSWEDALQAFFDRISQA